MSTSSAPTLELNSYCNELRRLQKFHDVVIKVQDRMFPCHRIILASAVEYFRVMFSGNYEEEEKKEVEMKGINADDFELLLTHIYSGKVSFEGDNVYGLLRISNYLSLQNLCNLCEEYILKNSKSIPLHTAINIFLFASKHGKVNLMEKFTEPLAINFSSVSKETRLFFISRVDLEKILSHPNLDNHLPAILDFVSNWTKYHPNEEKLDSVLSKINLQQGMKEWFMKKLKETIVSPIDEPTLSEESEDNIGGICNNSEMPFIFYVSTPIRTMVKKTEEIWGKQQYVEKSCLTHTNVSKQKLTNFSNLQYVNDLFTFSNSSYGNLRFCKSVFVNDVHCLVTFQAVQSTGTCIPHFQNKNGTYSSGTLYSIHYYEHNLSVASHGSSIYFCNNSRLRMFNCEVSKWIELLPKDNFLKTTCPNMVFKDNCLYMIGGARFQNAITASSDQFTVEDGRFFQYCDIREGIWRQLSKMIYPRNNSACSIYNDVLYVSGGENFTYLKSHVESYDFRSGSWSEFLTPIPMPSKKKCHIQTAYDNKLWFFDGSDSTWFSLDLKQKVWSDVYRINSDSTVWDVEVPRGKT